MPSPIVSHDEITIISLSGLASNLSKIILRSFKPIEELNPIIEIFVYFLFSGNSISCTFLNAVINSFSFTKLLTDVSLSVLTSE